MPYLVVLALGVILAVVGAASIALGLPIVQVERGWSAVIAGSSLLTGGLVIVALSSVLRAIGDLARTLERVPLAHGMALPTELQDPKMGQVPIMPAGGPEPPLLATPSAPEAELAPAEPSHHVAPHEPVSDHEASHADLAHADLAPADLVPVEPPPHTEPAHVEAHEPSPPMDDWLDHAAAAHETTATHDPAPTTHADEAPEAPHTAPPEPEPAAEPAVQNDSAAVIGRYEADGTSYVMYADGSIVAQSAAGVYRFASMAELKAFIEG